MAAVAKNMSAISDRQMKGLIRGLIYPIQFEPNPDNGVERVLDQIVYARAMNASPEEYLAAVQAALRSDERLSELIPQRHSEPVIRAFLAKIQVRIESGLK
jgi:hypothetical protein